MGAAMNSKTTIPPRLFKPREAAKYLAISERSLHRLKQEGQIPAVKFGQNVRYDIADLNSFIEGFKS